MVNWEAREWRALAIGWLAALLYIVAFKQMDWATPCVAIGVTSMIYVNWK